MKDPIYIYNTLTRTKEVFKPIQPPAISIYCCGPTVYGHAHLGHARGAIFFDVIRRYMCSLGYNVKYVRNITDVGHLERDTDTGEDKIAQKAHKERIDPMEVAQRYTHSYHQDMQHLQVQPPSIEPLATGHIPEQISLIQQLLAKGLAYVVNGSVYFDVEAFQKHHTYGKLSRRVVEELLPGTRSLNKQQEKKNPLDFALWKKALSSHIMRWHSPWGEGFPGWHTECVSMATKYLGQPFDIHGGGMDLLFPHHECEIAQAQALHKAPLANYWLHHNLVTIQGQKMSKSLGNMITIQQFLTGSHPLLTQAYSAMTLRFFVLQAHYRSTLECSNEALQAAHKGYLKLINGLKVLSQLTYPLNPKKAVDQKLTTAIQKQCSQCDVAMRDDFNTAQVIGSLFQLIKPIYQIKNGTLDPASIDKQVFTQLKKTCKRFTAILGLHPPKLEAKPFVNLVLDLYKTAKKNKYIAQINHIRIQMKQLGIDIQDIHQKSDWHYCHPKPKII